LREKMASSQNGKSIRGLCILQFCIVFTLLAWICSYPFMGELLTIKSKTLLLKEVMGIQDDSDVNEVHTQRLTKNKERFSQLPMNEQERIIERYKRMFIILFLEISRFELLWIILGIVIPVLLLLKVEGARQVVWLLPLLTLAFALDNQLAGINPHVSEDENLFPSEALIVEQYLNEPFSADINEQYHQLNRGWQNYLIREWTREPPSSDPGLYAIQLSEGEYAFNRARAELLPITLYPEGLFRTKHQMIVLIFYLAWNVFFAYKTSQFSKKYKPSNPCKVSH
jgi:hypothetical protein